MIDYIISAFIFIMMSCLFMFIAMLWLLVIIAPFNEYGVNWLDKRLDDVNKKLYSLHKTRIEHGVLYYDISPCEVPFVFIDSNGNKSKEYRGWIAMIKVRVMLKGTKL